MTWRATQAESRARYLQKYDAAEVESYDQWISQLTVEDHDAALQDIAEGFVFQPGMRVLDIGAGTGGACQILQRIEGLHCTALEPSPAMLAKLRTKPDCKDVVTVQGFCDHVNDAHLLPAAGFDVVMARHLVNGLYAPLVAFRNWWTWLKPGGGLVILEALFDRDSWKGIWAEEVDQLPFSACRSYAMIPYLLEECGFQIQKVGPMTATNRRPLTKTPRYMVIATKPS